MWVRVREGLEKEGGREGWKWSPSCGAAIVANQLTSQIAFDAQETKVLPGV